MTQVHQSVALPSIKEDVGQGVGAGVGIGIGHSPQQYDSSISLTLMKSDNMDKDDALAFERQGVFKDLLPRSTKGPLRAWQ